MSNDFDEDMAEYEDMDEEQPPCHEELMVPLFDIYKVGKTLSGGKALMPVDRIRESYPEIEENDLEQIIEYLEDAEDFCTEVCCCFSNYCSTPFVPQTEETQQNMARVIQACQKRYPWMQEKQIEYILNSTCWQSNR